KALNRLKTAAPVSCSTSQPAVNTRDVVAHVVEVGNDARRCANRRYGRGTPTRNEARFPAHVGDDPADGLAECRVPTVYSPRNPFTAPQTTRATTLSCRARTTFRSYPSRESSTWHGRF